MTLDLSHSEKLDRFQTLEQEVKNCSNSQQVSNPDLLNSQLLNEYIDLGLEMANKAKMANHQLLQESWLKRIYKTLFESTLNLVAPKHWRDLCLDSLYQPLFALKHLYRNHPQGKQRMGAIRHELSVSSHYLF